MRTVSPTLIDGHWGLTLDPSDWRDRPVASCRHGQETGVLWAQPCERGERELALDEARWPDHLRRLALRLQAGEADPNETDQTQAWLLLHAGLWRYLRVHASRISGCSPEDLEEIAARKALDLLLRITEGTWLLADRSRGEIAAFLSRTARNALIDRYRVRPPEAGSANEGPDPWDRAQAGGQIHASALTARQEPETTDAAVERREFAEALRECAQRLQACSRAVWFFRVFYEMPSKQIARHPEVNLRADHVDVLLQRCRQIIRDCMQEKGFQPHDMPPGTFAELWRAFRCQGAETTFPGGIR